jgi:hypothetical protein
MGAYGGAPAQQMGYGAPQTSPMQPMQPMQPQAAAAAAGAGPGAAARAGGAEAAREPDNGLRRHGRGGAGA